ncbi:hypothetical protein CRI77_12130 [Mycolicibacterium duvalii]|uniref:Uncharacterized protein n=1 Tax=Mycolicibacterium duvalii TaxID=39688 RepID=A0A7I7K9B1_9MYCO|nr:hypothetical protein [Mycolicibacterium duvalii]MCV7366274.1 hypothetical protein [Mycolicibacterium duvalii]PEG41043.1 hypothetical protein CRI77_12130 [Mycolicibacterium duvalii]BBX20101.1 hypothetical protein MDUV_49610 [Mycolicibacterium duvalii]
MPDTTYSNRTAAGWVAPAALVIALVAAVLAAWGLLRSDDSASSAGSVDKTQLCSAFETVRNAVSLQTNANLGPDRVATQAVAANARLATLGGGQYLRWQVSDAEPGELADAVRSFADDLTEIGMGQLAGAGSADQAQTERMNNAQTTAARVDELCA